jgi:uncharacterized membrane-anchored protein YhcB (DUF1043 family)
MSKKRTFFLVCCAMIAGILIGVLLSRLPGMRYRYLPQHTMRFGERAMPSPLQRIDQLTGKVEYFSLTDAAWKIWK